MTIDREPAAGPPEHQWTGPAVYGVPEAINRGKAMRINFGDFHARMYTCVPEQVREDMARIRDWGGDAITVSVLEQDLFAAVENLRIVAAAAHHQGLALYADIARWGRSTTLRTGGKT